MKMITAIAATVLTFASVSSFASGKNLVTCPWNDQDNEVTIRQDVGGQIVALFSMIDHGTVAYSVELVPVEPGVAGAGVTYQGKDLTLHVNTDGPGKDGYFNAELTIKELGITNQSIDCHLN